MINFLNNITFYEAANHQSGHKAIEKSLRVTFRTAPKGLFYGLVARFSRILLVGRLGGKYPCQSPVETESASESDYDNVDDTSSEVGDEYESDPWAPLKVEAAQQSLSEFEELTQNFTAEGFDENEAKDKAYLLTYPTKTS